MKYNKTNFFFNVMALLMVGIFAQSSFAGDLGEKENKGDGQQSAQPATMNFDRIFFIKPVEGEPEGVKVMESMRLKRDKNYYKNTTTNELHLSLRPEDFEGFPWSKFLGESRDDAISQSAAKDALEAFKLKRSRIEKHPGTFAFLVGVTSVAGTAALNMFFNK